MCFLLHFCHILKVYFACTTKKTIERIDINGGSREVVVSEGLDSPEGLAIDWIHRKMYWTDKRCAYKQNANDFKQFAGTKKSNHLNYKTSCYTTQSRNFKCL